MNAMLTLWSGIDRHEFKANASRKEGVGTGEGFGWDQGVERVRGSSPDARKVMAP